MIPGHLIARRPGEVTNAITEPTQLSPRKVPRLAGARSQTGQTIILGAGVTGLGAVADLAPPLEVLTDRELEVFEMPGQGLGTRQIAEGLRLGIKTVESYRARIKEELRLADGNQLLQHAIRWVQCATRQ